MTGVFTRVLSQPMFQTRRDPSCSRVCGNVDPGNLPHINVRRGGLHEVDVAAHSKTKYSNTFCFLLELLPTTQYRQVKQGLVCLLRLLCSACIHFLFSCVHIFVHVHSMKCRRAHGRGFHSLSFVHQPLPGVFWSLSRISLPSFFASSLMYVAFLQEQSENAAGDHF